MNILKIQSILILSCKIDDGESYISFCKINFNIQIWLPPREWSGTPVPQILHKKISVYTYARWKIAPYKSRRS